MKAKDYLEWVRYKEVGGKRMFKNYSILRKHNPTAFKKLEKIKGRLRKKKQEMGKLLQFPIKTSTEDK